MSWSWLAWSAFSLCTALLLGTVMFLPDWTEGGPIDRTAFLPGATTDGHYQIELACESCHTQNFADQTSLQAACLDCHGAELERADDSHPERKFTDPRNADRIASLDARWCTTCHQEHRPEITQTMGLSLPGDYCYRCHQDIGEERVTHRDLAFDSCASAGCHNFHDNKALYEDFLVEHRSEPDFRPVMRVPGRTPEPATPPGAPPLTAQDQDGPETLAASDPILVDWAASAHARGRVSCTDCHAADESAWTEQPARAVCADCHSFASEGFEASRHGMRLAAGLSPLDPADARRPMQPDSHGAGLDCNTCHPAHRYDTTFAAAEACLGCHADDHSLAYEDSPHSLTWAEARTRGDQEQDALRKGVSCATCHLPRVHPPGRPRETRVAHNQNDFLRPNEKMIRPVCQDCHGLAFSIDSLADPALITTNFRGRPARRVESIHYASELRWRLEGKTPPWEDADPKDNEP